MSIVRDEVGKAAKTLDTVHIIYSATVGKQLIGAMPDGEYQVLTLRSWNSKTAAVFAFPTKASVTLLWRPPTADGSSDQWYEFPDQETVSVAVVSEGVTIVEVRPGLEVVIPHHDAVSRLVGPELFDSLKALSKDDIDNSSAVGSVITTLGEALGSASSQQQQQQQQEQKHDDDPFAAYDDSTRMEVVVQAIAKERSYSELRMGDHLSKLTELEIDTVGDLRSLSVERIEKLGMPPVVTEYLQRVKKSH
jgi:hypothetical protein